ncbi:hypothetical protein ACOTTU_12855 [Roseobacter sp. EG26]|uniref:hypothetical protein n=1 Tax=Roseobacter sp. EG26 TaxID=3412477 RepID=UPI003CE4B189
MIRYFMSGIALMALGLPVFGQDLHVVSLGGLQSEASVCHPGCDEKILRLSGLTDLDAYVVDTQHSDILLVGRKEPGRIALRLSDLALALQATAYKFAKEEGRVLVVSELAVSLDPSPENVAALMAVGDALSHASQGAQLQAVLDRWVALCENPHTASVYGMPRSAGISKAALSIDYALKRQVSGASRIPSDRYFSLTDLTRQEIEADFFSDHPKGVELSGLSRFWITPRKGTYRYDEAAQAAIIDDFGLEILTEQQKLVGSEVVDRGGPGRLPAKWAERATELIPVLLEIDEDWQRVDQFARMLALAHMIRDEGALETSTLSLDWLIDAFAGPVEEVPSGFAGHPHIERFELSKSQGNMRMTSNVVLPSCGGVSFRIELEKLPPEIEPDRQLRDFADGLRHE